MNRCLLAADAFPEVIARSLDLSVEIAVFKLSHHGSQANTSVSLLNAIRCKKFLISTDGSIHHHPDQALIARILEHVPNPEFIFNYENSHTSRWRTPPRGWPQYTCQFPRWDELFVRIPLPYESEGKQPSV